MTKLVGILNLTPDSFSDGGKYDGPEASYAYVETLIAEGADVIDIGAESTRPHATPISADKEWQRLSPVFSDITALAHRHNVLVSVDTRHAETAAQAIRHGADWINDVSCGASPALLHTVAESESHYVAMHALTVPADPKVTLPDNRPAILQVMETIHILLERLDKAGIAQHRVILDAGLGFGKTAKQSLSLLWDMPQLATLGCPVLVGHSRKSFLYLLSAHVEHRDMLTLLASSYLIHAGMHYLRVHDVGSHATLRKNLSV